jgi:hypothetical protein
MKVLLIFTIFSISYLTHKSYKTYSPNRPDIDTVSILGLTPGLDGKLVGGHISQKMDTLLWNDDGTGITKFSGSFLSSKGEYRLAYDKGMISQVSFVAPTHNQDETIKIYGQISHDLADVYGTADIESSNTVHEMRWEGLKQSISVKAVDGTGYVTIALSKFEKN